MKKFAIYMVLAVMALCVVSCRYDEGPFLSFRKPEDRIVGYWKLKEVYENGQQVTENVPLPNQPGSYYAFFTERMLSVTALKDSTVWKESDNGAWNFDNHYKEIMVWFIMNNKTYEYQATIKRLTRDELIYEFNDKNQDHWRFVFESRSSMYY